MDIGRYSRSRKNVGQWLRLMSVWALSPWPHRIWQEQSQAGVTASIHLLVSCNREGAFVQGRTCTNAGTQHTLQPVYASKDAFTHTHICHTGTHKPVSTHTHTHSGTHWRRKKKKSLPGRLQCVSKKSFCDADFLQNVCELPCPIMGDKWRDGLRLCPNLFALDMKTVSLKFVHLCWWRRETLGDVGIQNVIKTRLMLKILCERCFWCDRGLSLNETTWQEFFINILRGRKVLKINIKTLKSN